MKIILKSIFTLCLISAQLNLASAQDTAIISTDTIVSIPDTIQEIENNNDTTKDEELTAEIKEIPAVKISPIHITQPVKSSPPAKKVIKDTQQATEPLAKDTTPLIRSSRDTLTQKTDSLITELNEKLEEEATESEESDFKKILTGNNIFYSIVLLLIGYFIIRVITFLLNALAERSTTYRIAFKGSIPIVKIIGWVIILTLIIMVIFQPTASTMLAFSASIGVAVGFASQDILKNIFGGIVILLDRPFVSGDKIEIDKYYGEVVEIGLRSTRIVTPDDSLVAVPNAVMMNSSLSNSNSGEPNCQVVAEIFLPITIDAIAVRKIATQAATVSKYIYLEKPIVILFINEVNNNHTFYKMKVKAYVMDIRDEFKFKSEMTELIIKELVQQNILDGKF